MDKLQNITRRLSKVARDLNVGISNLGEFLHKKGVTIDVGPNTKINDEQYQLLVAEFSKDKKQKQAAIDFLENKQQKADSRETVAIPGYEKKKESEPKSDPSKQKSPGIRVIGSIDLDSKSGEPIIAEPEKAKTKVQEKQKEEKEEKQEERQEEKKEKIH